ncbi:MAG: helix-hairpin-helix domain-containing protein, partial [bacterium]|nr:helix-hairpin-helix domain-containing protein [bacterium]
MFSFSWAEGRGDVSIVAQRADIGNTATDAKWFVGDHTPANTSLVDCKCGFTVSADGNKLVSFAAVRLCASEFTMTNNQIADTLDELADLLEFQGANAFRIRAYRNGSRAIRELGESIAKIVESHPAELTKIDGIGK